MKSTAERHPPELIVIPERLRSGIDIGAVARLQESISKFGLMTPISVRWVDGEDGADLTLVAGRHRLEACRRLDMEFIDCIILQGGEIECRLWEIAENLHRAELNAQERADHIAEWVRLTEEKQKNDAAQLAPHRKAGQQPGGINAAVRELGIDRTEAQRAVKIASINEDARKAADDAGLNSQKARLEIAKAEDQTAKVHELAERKAKPAPAIKNAFESEEDWRRALFTVWNRGAQDWRERALEAMDTPVFDRTAAGRA